MQEDTELVAPMPDAPCALWDDDTGDMTAPERDALCALVTQPFVTSHDTIRGDRDAFVIDVIASDEASGQRIRRELDNLGRELVVEATLGIAYARQRDEVDTLGIRRTARRRTVRTASNRGLVDADILFMALKLRNYLDEMQSSRNPTDKVSENELYQWFAASPSAKRESGNAEAIRRAFDRCIEACKMSSTGIGLISKVTAEDAYVVLPTVLLLVTDDFATEIADATTTDETGNEDGK